MSAARNAACLTYFCSSGVAACAKSHVFANNKLKGWGTGWGHTVVAPGGQQGVRARIHAAGKALEEDDRHTDDDKRFVHYMMIIDLNG